MLVCLTWHHHLVASLAAVSVRAGAALAAHDLAVVAGAEGLVGQRRVALGATEAVLVPVAILVVQLLNGRERRCLLRTLQPMLHYAMVEPAVRKYIFGYRYLTGVLIFLKWFAFTTDCLELSYSTTKKKPSTNVNTYSHHKNLSFTKSTFHSHPKNFCTEEV